MKKLIHLSVIAVFLATGSVAYCQQTQTAPAASGDSPLVQAAKKERERREKLKEATKPAKAFTNQDIEEFKARNKDAEGSSSTEEETTTEETTQETTTSVDEGQNEEVWRKRSRDVANKIKATEDKVEQLQTDINALTQSFYAESDGVAQRGQIEAQRNERLNALEAAKKELEAAKQAQEDLRDEARRAGALPGWIEE